MEAILEIISVVASANDVNDAKATPDLLQDALIEINQVGAESAYDRLTTFTATAGIASLEKTEK